MTSINPINVNTQGIGASYGFNNKSKSSEEAKEEEIIAPEGQKTPVSADEVLNYMAQSAVSVTPKAVVDPSKYVDEASRARIEGFMAGFEDIVAQNLTAITAEFPEMSDSSKQTLALANVNKQM